MEAAVKLINPSTSVDDSQRRWTKLAICLRGHKHATCVINDDSGIRLIRIPVKDYDRSAQDRSATNPPKTVAQRLLAFTTREVAPKPITQGALDVLQRVISGDIPAKDVEFDTSEVAKASETPAGTHNGSPVGRSGLLAAICSELKIEPSAARRRLRKAGLHAPYEDERAIRTALTH